MREKMLFDDNWLFHKGDIEHEKMPLVKGQTYSTAKTERMRWGPAAVYYNDHPDDFVEKKECSPDRWENVTLPHDYIINGEMSSENNNALGFFEFSNGWYRKHFTVDEADYGRRITLLFDGVASIATVYLNGCLLKHSFSGYTPFEVDITDYVKFSEDNVIAVYCQQNRHEGWWYEGGGIYRHVWMIKTERVAVDLYGVYVNAQRRGESDGFDINIETTLVNAEFNEQHAQLHSEVIDASGQCVASASGELSVGGCDKATAKYATVLDSPVLWDFDNPYQYTLKTTVLQDGRVVDEYSVKFGCRYFSLDANEGFFLNGKKRVINGVCGHQDFGLTGKAVPDNIHHYKIGLIKQMGANGYRCSHYPQTEAIMDALDEQGFFVMAETRWFESSDEGIEQLEMHIRRDRNRPSIFMWSLGNEEEYHTTDMGRRISRSMMAAVRRLDSTRIITTAISTSPDQAELCADLDAIGINYNHWLHDALREKYPDRPIYVSECCATSTTRGWYYDDDQNRAYLPAYDRDTNSWFTGREFFALHLSKRPYLFAAFQWIAFEHRGETVWPRICSQSGAIDLFMQKKDAFYQNKSHWSDEPMIHLLPHWNFAGREGEPIQVFAYTNCDEAELLLNGRSLGRQTVQRYVHCEWSVPYEAGELVAVAYRDGQEIARDARVTTGAPAALALRLENDNIRANGRDIAVFTCYCVDEQGRAVPDAAEFVSFNTNRLGRVVGTGSDVSDHIPVCCPERKMRAGTVSVAVMLGEQSGELRLYAHSDRLGTASIAVNID